MRNPFNAAKDERIQAELNSIYRIGYLVLMFGILFDLFLQYVPMLGAENVSVRPVEFAVFLVANILCLVLMVRKGISDDDSRYAEADSFPRGYYIRVSLLGALMASVLFGAIQVYRFSEIGLTDTVLVVLITTASIFIFTAPTIFGVQYFCYRLAKKRRDKMEQTYNDDEK